MTTSLPSCWILMELSAQLELRGMLLDLNWAKREESVLADNPPNGFFEDFDPRFRVEFDLKSINLKFISTIDLQEVTIKYLLSSSIELISE